MHYIQISRNDEKAFDRLTLFKNGITWSLIEIFHVPKERYCKIRDTYTVY